MVFSSFTFIFLFLPITLLLYYLVPKKHNNIRNIILLLMSLIFYAWGEPIYVVLMIISIIVNYLLGLMIDKMKWKKLLLIIAIIINIGLLFFYKYSNFLIININNIFGSNINPLKLTLPIGISFYTFQILSYIIDVYKKKVNVQKNIFTLATYIALFPQLIAGPIVRYITVEEELSKRTESFNNFASGAKRFILGLAKKVIIANNAAIIADAVFNANPNSLGCLIVWGGAIAYSLQIYFDFSGYSDMAIGLGKMFGFNFLENFDYPYIATSITDFWRRWHISLSTWFRDYIYIPLGGNKVSKIKWLRNILIVWLLTGLWHGASWNFVIWGVYYAVLLIIEKIFLQKLINKLPKLIKHMYSLLLIIIGWVIFRVEDISTLAVFISRMFSISKSDYLSFISKNGSVLFTWVYVVIGIICCTPLIKKLLDKLSNNERLSIIYDIIVLLIFAITIMLLESSSYNPFIYFRF